MTTAQKKAMGTIDLDALVLDAGSHESPEDGMCLMEAVSCLAGEPWSDHPKCTSPELTKFGLGLNDRLNDEQRQRLKPFVRRLVGTNLGPELDQRLRLMSIDWLIRTFIPAWLRLAWLAEEADTLEALEEITSRDELEAVTPVVEAVQKKAIARQADGGASSDPRAASKIVGWLIAPREDGGALAWDASRLAGMVAAGEETPVAEGVLEPADRRLQDSAIGLFERMIEVAEGWEG